MSCFTLTLNLLYPPSLCPPSRLSPSPSSWSLPPPLPVTLLHSLLPFPCYSPPLTFSSPLTFLPPLLILPSPPSLPPPPAAYQLTKERLQQRQLDIQDDTRRLANQIGVLSDQLHKLVAKNTACLDKDQLV